MTIRTIFGNCLEVMVLLPDASIDMVLCDLPYGTTQNKWDCPLPLDDLWRQYRRLCPNGAIVFTAAQPFASTLIASARGIFRYDLIWRKNKGSGHLNAKRQPLRQHEHVLIFSINAPPYYPQKTNGHRASTWARRSKGSTNYGDQRPTVYESTTERYPISVLDFPVVNNDGSHPRLHPTQKPVDLFEYLIRTYTNEGATVIDPTAGSGTTGVAAARSGRNAILIESDPVYFNGMVKQLRDEKIDPKIEHDL